MSSDLRTFGQLLDDYLSDQYKIRALEKDKKNVENAIKKIARYK